MEKTLISPAKVNLFLRVVRKREDGYHEIVSLVDLISLFDEIKIMDLKEDKIVVKKVFGEMPEGEDNIIYRAVRLIKKQFEIKKGVYVEVTKRIPIGSGLGGGSSNAATVIKTLMQMWNLKISEEELLDLGKALGADVPLFLYGKPCMIRGIGEKIAPITLPTIWYVIVFPGVEIPTKEVYSNFKFVLTKTENDIKLRNHFNALEEIAGILENDLEDAAQRLCPRIKTIKEKLIKLGAKGASMSGSGSSVFGCFESKSDAERVAKSLESCGQVFVARSI
ncbi:MAG: 4-(cytidine 5'-diphospho)-2-C-methyl-D-erythritol kinase [Deltaproteobacteria bacterium]|nr:4-(cytidine 5'-diphospho)-2-C-methyl-D-erythritol kinase [Deltaproteobacteria bacterium]